MDKEMSETKQIAGKEKPAEKEKPDVLACYRHAEGCKKVLDAAKKEYDAASKNLIEAMQEMKIERLDQVTIVTRTSATFAQDCLGAVPAENRQDYMRPDNAKLQKQCSLSERFKDMMLPFMKVSESQYLKWLNKPGGTVTKKGK